MIGRITSWACLALAALAPPAGADSVFGEWIPPGGDAVVRILETAEGATLRLVALLEAGATDAENPDAALRSRRLAGIVLGEGFRRDGSWWSGGSLYDPASGKSYQARFRLDGPDRLELRGYVGAPLFGQTQRWVRKSDFQEAMLRMLGAEPCEGRAMPAQGRTRPPRPTGSEGPER